jgi:glycosyltransferase involved in cell wall biosynthesis
MPASRLLLVLTEFPPSFGGMQTHAVELAHRLHAHGHPIQVITYRPADSIDATFPFPVLRCLSRLSYWANAAKIARAARAFHAEAIYSSTVYYAHAGRLANLPVFCRSAGNDVLRPWIAWPFRLGSSLLDQPAFEKHLYPWLRNRDWPDRLDRFLHRSRSTLTGASARMMENIAANSAFTVSLLHSLGVESPRVSLLPGGVDTARFSPGPSARARFGWPAQAFMLFTACRLVEKKGLTLLLEALAELSGKLPHLALAIAGDGPDRARLESLAIRLGLAARVHFTGRLSPAQLALAYRSADLFVLSSRTVFRANGVADAETMGRVLCEANAAGLPVLASRTGGVPSLIEHNVNGLLFAENSLPDLCRSISELAADPALRSRLAAAGRARALREFSWDVLFERQQRTIFNVLSTTGSSIISEKKAADGERNNHNEFEERIEWQPNMK